MFKSIWLFFTCKHKNTEKRQTNTWHLGFYYPIFYEGTFCSDCGIELGGN